MVVPASVFCLLSSVLPTRSNIVKRKASTMRKPLMILLALVCGAALAFEAKFEGEKVVFECPVAGTFRLECQTGKVKLAASDGAVDFAVMEARATTRGFSP